MRRRVGRRSPSSQALETVKHDVDQADDEIRIRQQVLRVKGRLWTGPVKTAAGRRDLPLLQLASDVLSIRRDVQGFTVWNLAAPGRTTT